jgi:hypothetical protein
MSQFPGPETDIFRQFLVPIVFSRIVPNRKRKKQFEQGLENGSFQDFLGPEIDIMSQFLAPETERMCQFLGPEADIMAERYYIKVGLNSPI